MPLLGSELNLDRCPYCQVNQPSLRMQGSVIKTKDYLGDNAKVWKTYVCSRCGGVALANSLTDDGLVGKYFPSTINVHDSIPSPAKDYLEQAIESIHAPAGSIMLSASAVDSMLKAKALKEGSLYARIDKAATEHLITIEMAQWAHEVRLDANAQRHADEEVSLPTSTDAQRCVDFVLALGMFLFVLPAKVKNGLEEAIKT
jgi:hypothetical protein